MLEKFLYGGVDVHVVELAVVKRFATAVLAPCDVKLVFAVVVEFVVGVEGTSKNFDFLIVLHAVEWIIGEFW